MHTGKSRMRRSRTSASTRSAPSTVSADDFTVINLPQTLSSRFGSRELVFEPQHYASTSSINLSEDSESQADELVEEIAQEDMVIAVMGATGAGKSTFIAIATEVTGDNIVGHQLESFTQKMQIVRCRHPNQQRDVVFVDTPGFDDTELSDIDILNEVAKWLVKTYKRDIKLSGLLYLHRITDNRMGGTPLRNLSMFRKLCGTDALKNVLLVTTMWNEEDQSIGATREAQLRKQYWKSMLVNGSRMFRFDGSRSSAWNIVQELHGPPKPVLLQREMVDHGLDLHQTTAGRPLFQWLVNFIQDIKEAIQKLDARLRKKSLNEADISAIIARKAKDERDLARANAQLGRMQRRKTRVVNALVKWSSVLSTNQPSSPPDSAANTDASPSTAPDPVADIDPPIPTHVEEIVDVEDGRGRLDGSITALRIALAAVSGSRVPFLQETVGLTLSIALAVNAMKATKRSLLRLAQHSSWLMVAISEQSTKGDIADEMKVAIQQFNGELEGVQRLIAKLSKSGKVQRFAFQAADEATILECNQSIQLACNLLGMQANIINNQALIAQKAAISKIEAYSAAIARIEAQLAFAFKGTQQDCRHASAEKPKGIRRGVTVP